MSNPEKALKKRTRELTDQINTLQAENKSLKVMLYKYNNTTHIERLMDAMKERKRKLDAGLIPKEEIRQTLINAKILDENGDIHSLCQDL